MARVAYIISPTCSCGNYLGRRQIEFEELTSKGTSMVDAVTYLGFNKMCCRNSFLNSSLYFILSTDIGRIVDRTGLINGTGQQENYVVNTPDIILKRKPPNFPILPGSVDFREVIIKSKPIEELVPIPSMVNFLTSLPVFNEPPVTIFTDQKE